MKKTLLLSIISLIFIIFCLFYFEPSKAQNFSDEPILKNLQVSSNVLNGNFIRLINIAQEKGNVPVIVGFRFDFTPEGYLTNSLKDNQRAEIRENQDALLQKLEAFKPKNVKQFETIPYFAVTIDAETLEFLKTLSEVTFIREDELHAPTLFESTQVVRAPQAWNAGFSGQGQVIAILDTGVDKNHPFLSGKVISDACYSTTDSQQGVSSLCPGGVFQSTATNSGLNCNTSIIGCSHGTHVAGIAAGRATNVSGVARDANLVAIQVFSRIDNPQICGSNMSCARTSSSDYVLGLQRVFTLKQSGVNIASANMSLGSPDVFTGNCDSQVLDVKAAIDNLRSVGVATVIASGNGDSSGNGYINALSKPACISSAISVGSTGDGSSGAIVDFVSSFSNSASFLNLLAPGQWIFSSVPNGSYENMAGTSQATPHVAGAWAVLKQRNPNASVGQILNALSTTGQPITDSRNGIVKPRINIESALQTLPCSSSIIAGQTINNTLTTSDCAFSGTTRYVDVYVFDGVAGQRIAVSMNSTAFDTYLFLVNSSNQIIAQDDDGGGGTNSRIPATSGFFTLPATGTYSIQATSFDANRTGAYSISLVNETVCNFSITPTSQSFPSSGGNGFTNVTTQSGCNWSAVSNAQWITTASNGSGNGSVGFSVNANTGVVRTGTITVAGQILTITQAGFIQSSNHRNFDFDGDNKTDVGIFRPAPGQWWYRRSSDGSSRAFSFGQSADKVVAADYTGDGKTDIAFFRPSTGFWFILRSEDSSFYSFPFGNSTDIPTPADFDGDGRADPAIFRPSTREWFIINSSGGTTITTFGIAGDLPVAADYDGDAKADIGIYRPSNGQWWLNRTTAGLIVTTFGTSTDKTVQADYTGDGKADVAFFRPSTREWFILRSENFSFYSAPFGTTGDIPTPGDYDGDGRTDFSIFRPSNNTWYLQQSTSGFTAITFGITNDIPIPNAYVR